MSASPPPRSETNDSLTNLRAALADRYTIGRELGAGGMATVYLARDLKLDRDVALKVLRPELAARVGAERFNSEIRVTARLAHPHILSLHESGEAGGALYYVMPFVDGETLRQRLARDGRIPVAEAVRIAREVLDALAHAHDSGVIHRDIKPENILLRAGHALLSDFGIARAVGTTGGDRITEVGLVLGTPAYMSPEQAAGELHTDARSDVYSMACVVFEMLTGEPPFSGRPSEMMARRLTQAPPDPSARQADVPEALGDAVVHALATVPERRTSSAADFAEALAAASRPGVAAAPKSQPADRLRLAVLPFANLGNDPDAEFFSDGISEDILTSLARVSGLRVIARTSSFAFKGKQVDVREVGRTLAVGHVLEGSVRRSGKTLRISAQLVDATSGDQLWSEQYDREITDIFAVQDELTANIRDELSKRLLGVGQAPSQGAPAIDPETYELFLRGRYLVDQRVDGMKRGMELLQQVVQRAPRFAPGYAALGNAYATLGYYCVLPSKEGYGMAKDLAARAITMDPTDPFGHAIAGHASLYLDWDWPAAFAHYSRAAELAPNDWFAASTLSLYYVSLGRFDEAIVHATKGIRADPLNPSALNHLALILHLARRYVECIAICDRVIEIAPVFSEAHRWKGLSLHQLGRTKEGLEFVKHASALSGRHVWSVANLALLHWVAGDLAMVDTLMSEVEERAKTEPVPANALAISGFRSNPPDMDFIWNTLQRAIEERNFWLVMTRVEPFFDLVREDPRYKNFVAQIGIPELPAS